MTCQNTKRMVRVFMGQMILVASLFAFDEYLSSWVLRTMIATALLLPLIAYLTIFAQPPVYRAWKSGLLELYQFGSFCITTALGYLSLKSIFRLCRFVLSLRLLPVTSDEWAALLLFPFKVFVVVALPFLWLSCSLVQLIEPRLRYARFPEAIFVLSEGYALCLGILLFGALLQALFSHRGRSTQTLFVFFVGVAFFWMLRP
jgi:hypothetical protein